MIMKHTFLAIFCASWALLAGSCARHTIIPDDELALIFHDAFLTNAYTGNRSAKLDSLNLYEPIFAAYGYTTSDVQYTIGNFSKRKSARLGDVVERAIALLEAEGKVYNREVAILDTIDNVARRTFTRRVHYDSLIRVRTLRDTSRLRFSIDVRPGEYDFRLKYLVDSLDVNRGLRGATWMVRRDSSRSSNYTFFLRRDRPETFTRRFTVDSTIAELHLDFAVFREKPARPSITLRDVEVKYIPPTDAAVDSLYLQQLPVRIFADEFFRAASLTPDAVPQNSL